VGHPHGRRRRHPPPYVHARPSQTWTRWARLGRSG
jgi:hypothetical protein